MRRHNFRCLALWNSRSANYQWNVNVFFEAASLSWLQTVLADVKPIVRRINNVCVLKNPQILKFLENSVNHFVDSLERSKTVAINFVIVVNFGLILLRELCNPA